MIRFTFAPPPDPARYPDLPGWAADMQRWGADLVNELETNSTANDQPADTVFTMSNITTTTSLDGSAATLASTRNALGTVVNALVNLGIFKSRSTT